MNLHLQEKRHLLQINQMRINVETRKGNSIDRKKDTFQDVNVKFQVQNVPELWHWRLETYIFPMDYLYYFKTRLSASWICIHHKNRFIGYFWLTKKMETSGHHLWRSMGKGVLFKTFDVKVQVQNFDIKLFEKCSIFCGMSQLCRKTEWLKV